MMACYFDNQDLGRPVEYYCSTSSKMYKWHVLFALSFIQIHGVLNNNIEDQGNVECMDINKFAFVPSNANKENDVSNVMNC